MANHYTRQIPDLSEAQEQELQRWVRRAKTAQALVLRARIVLQTAAGKSDMEVAGQLGTTRATVGKWRRRFLRDGCDGLLDEPRPGAPRTIGDDDVERVVVQTLETIPAGATHWSTRSMAKACGLSAATVSRIWRAFGLAASLRDLQAVARSAVHREGTRRRGSVPASARARGGVVRGREAADSSVGAQPAGTADASRPRRAAHPRLPPARNHLVVCGPGRSHRWCSADASRATGRWSSAGFDDIAKASRRTSTFIWCWTTTARTRRRCRLAGCALPPALHAHERIVDNQANGGSLPNGRSGAARTAAPRSWLDR